MNNIHIITLLISCDDDFVERYTKEDPFHRFNQLFHNEVDVIQGALNKKNLRVEVSEDKHTRMGFTHRVKYFVNVHENWNVGKDLVRAIMVFHNAYNIIDYKIISAREMALMELLNKLP